jgi:serine O-acetyltransferase
MNPLLKLKYDLVALHERKLEEGKGIKNFFLDTIKNIIFLPPVWFIIVFRFGQFLIPIKPIYWLYMVFIWRPTTVITGIEIYPSTKIGPGLVIPHFGQIFINPQTEIGENCLIFNGVTVGCDFVDRGSPVLGDRVKIGVGAKIIGHIKIANDVKINANQVVSKDIT